MLEMIEIDKLVAEKVMHWKVSGTLAHSPDGTCYEVDKNYIAFVTRFNPSVDMNSAWMVAEEIHLFDDRYIMETTNGWGIYEVAPHYDVAKEIVCDIETAPLAICLAALSCVGFDPYTLLTLRETDLLRSRERGAEDQLSMFAGDGSE